MTIDPWIGLGGLAVTLLGFLLKHVIADARYRQKVDELARRVSKLDGIDANGGN